MKNNQTLSTIILGLVSGAVGALFVTLVVFNTFGYQPYAMMRAMTGIAPLQQNGNAGQPLATFGTATASNDQVREASVEASVTKANPAVVSIIITKDVPILEQYNAAPSDPFGDFFGFNFSIPQYRQNGTQKKEVGGGSGFLVSKDGYIITNRHVVDQTDAQYTVLMNDGKKFDAKVLARDPVNDLAIIKIEGNSFPYLEFGNSDNLHVGQTAIAIGNALAEFRNTVSVGVISGLKRSVTAGDNSGQSELLEGVIQTDAAINPGNSGGPLLNLNGQVIGVNVAVAQGSQSIGFALPGNLARSIVDSVKKSGKIVRPYLGVRYVPVTAELKEKNKLSVDYGALVIRGDSADQLAVLPGSPADKAGIVENDIILELDGNRIDETHTLAALIRAKNVGDTVKLTILSKGAQKTTSATLTEVPE